MLELGEFSYEYHKKIIPIVIQAQPRVVITVGKISEIISKNLPKNLNDVVATNDKFFSSFLNKCISEGIYFAPSKFEAGFISTKHTKLEINHTINVIEKILKKGI